MSKPGRPITASRRDRIARQAFRHEARRRVAYQANIDDADADDIADVMRSSAQAGALHVFRVRHPR